MSIALEADPYGKELALRCVSLQKEMLLKTDSRLFDEAYELFKETPPGKIHAVTSFNGILDIFPAQM